jgi:transcriptional regulator with XRE-family HTH domain
MVTVTEQLRRFVRECGKTRYQLSKECGVSAGQLSRFVNGKTLSMDVMDRICEHLQLELRKRSPRK